MLVLLLPHIHQWHRLLFGGSPVREISHWYLSRRGVALGQTHVRVLVIRFGGFRDEKTPG